MATYKVFEKGSKSRPIVITADYVFNNEGELIFRRFNPETCRNDVVETFAPGSWSRYSRTSPLQPREERATGVRYAQREHTYLGDMDREQARSRINRTKPESQYVMVLSDSQIDKAVAKAIRTKGSQLQLALQGGIMKAAPKKRKSRRK